MFLMKKKEKIRSISTRHEAARLNKIQTFESLRREPLNTLSPPVRPFTPTLPFLPPASMQMSHPYTTGVDDRSELVLCRVEKRDAATLP